MIFKGAGKRGMTQAEKNEIIRSRHQVEAMLKSNNIHELRQAVFEADKLVDQVLRAKNYRGETMGERLKSAREYIDRNVYDGIWQGHKVRNQLAHEHQVQLSTSELKQAVEKLLRYIKSM